MSHATPWQIDASHTNIDFAVRHLMVATVRGRFAEVEGTLTYDDARPNDFALAVTIQAASIDTRNEQRDAHLRSADFFDVERFPTLTFVGRSLEGDPSGTFTLTGDLTIRDVTRSITLSAESGGQHPDPWGNTRAGFSARGSFLREDFGLTWNQMLETGGVMVSNEVKIQLDVEFVRPN